MSRRAVYINARVRYNRSMKRFALLAAVLLLCLAGCGHVVSEQLRSSARDIPPQALFATPDAYRGAVVILGGVIVGSANTKEGTYLEVVQKPLDSRGRPEERDVSSGRFLILYDSYLDTAIYARGRTVTVAGEVVGTERRRLDEIEYPYLLLRGREVHIVEPGRPLPLWLGIGFGARL